MSSTELVKASVYDQFVAQAELTPGIAAIVAPGRLPLSYTRLLSQLEIVRESVNAFGLGRNDRVVIVLDNGPEMAVAFMGSPRALLLCHSIQLIAPMNLSSISHESTPKLS
jgi:acyl-CoA synthetase (AMP-forming)/AMP-acid ligase II